MGGWESGTGREVLWAGLGMAQNHCPDSNRITVLHKPTNPLLQRVETVELAALMLHSQLHVSLCDLLPTSFSYLSIAPLVGSCVRQCDQRQLVHINRYLERAIHSGIVLQPEDHTFDTKLSSCAFCCAHFG